MYMAVAGPRRHRAGRRAQSPRRGRGTHFRCEDGSSWISPEIEGQRRPPNRTARIMVELSSGVKGARYPLKQVGFPVNWSAFDGFAQARDFVTPKQLYSQTERVDACCAPRREPGPLVAKRLQSRGACVQPMIGASGSKWT